MARSYHAFEPSGNKQNILLPISSIISLCSLPDVHTKKKHKFILTEIMTKCSRMYSSCSHLYKHIWLSNEINYQSWVILLVFLFQRNQFVQVLWRQWVPVIHWPKFIMLRRRRRPTELRRDSVRRRAVRTALAYFQPFMTFSTKRWRGRDCEMVHYRPSDSLF